MHMHMIGGVDRLILVVCDEFKEEDVEVAPMCTCVYERATRSDRR